MQSKPTCFVCLALFLIAPGLQRIPAFNMRGEDWDKSLKGAKDAKGTSKDAELRIAWDTNAKLLGVFAISHDRQTRMRKNYAKQLGEPCVFEGTVELLPVHSEKRAVRREQAWK